MRKIVQILLCFIICISACSVFAGCETFGVRNDEKKVENYYFVLDFGNTAAFSTVNGKIKVQNRTKTYVTTNITKGNGYSIFSDTKLKFTGSVDKLPTSEVSNFLGWYYALRPKIKVELDGEGDLKVDISTVRSSDGSILIFPKFSDITTQYEK